MCDHTFIPVIQLSALHIGLHTCPLTHRLFRLSIWVLGRPFKPCPPWPSVPPPSDGGFMRSNIDGVRFCVRYITWPACWYQAHSGGGPKKRKILETLAACSHTGAPSQSTWLWVIKFKFPCRLHIWDLLVDLIILHFLRISFGLCSGRHSWS